MKSRILTADRRVFIRGQDQRFENQENERLKTGWHAQREAEEKASNPSQEGRQPFHQRTLRLRGQASAKAVKVCTQ